MQKPRSVVSGQCHRAVAQSQPLAVKSRMISAERCENTNGNSKTSPVRPTGKTSAHARPLQPVNCPLASRAWRYIIGIPLIASLSENFTSRSTLTMLLLGGPAAKCHLPHRTRLHHVNGNRARAVAHQAEVSHPRQRNDDCPRIHGLRDPTIAAEQPGVGGDVVNDLRRLDEALIVDEIPTSTSAFPRRNSTKFRRMNQQAFCT